MKVCVKAPAKINLSLDIVCKRPDGYHDVAMILQSVSLYDTLTFEPLDDGSSELMKINCGKYDVPLDSNNLVYKAAKAFYAHTSVEPVPLFVDIDKKIPTQAGLAGGSSDAAATVLALNKLYSSRLTEAEMVDICSKVGSDVPFCLLGGTMLATGTGTTLKKLRSLPKCRIVICKPDISVSTAEAYALCDKQPRKDFLYTDELIKRLYARDIRGVASCLYNEFEQVLTLPVISDIKKEMMEHKALGASMSGSGSAVFGIFLNEKKAAECCDALSKRCDDVFMCEPSSDGCAVI